MGTAMPHSSWGCMKAIGAWGCMPDTRWLRDLVRINTGEDNIGSVTGWASVGLLLSTRFHTGSGACLKLAFLSSTFFFCLIPFALSSALQYSLKSLSQLSGQLRPLQVHPRSGAQPTGAYVPRVRCRVEADLQGVTSTTRCQLCLGHRQSHS